jgi:hypothetical protein
MADSNIHLYLLMQGVCATLFFCYELVAPPSAGWMNDIIPFIAWE